MAGIILAILIMADGARIVAPMPNTESCIEFTRTIALYVESANCIG